MHPASLGPAFNYGCVFQPFNGTDQRSSGPVVQWSSGPVVQRSSGPVVQWSSGPVVQRSRGPVVQWSSGPVVQWSSGPHRRCCSWLGKRSESVTSQIQDVGARWRVPYGAAGRYDCVSCRSRTFRVGELRDVHRTRACPGGTWRGPAVHNGGENRVRTCMQARRRHGDADDTPLVDRVPADVCPLFTRDLHIREGSDRTWST